MQERKRVKEKFISSCWFKVLHFDRTAAINYKELASTSSSYKEEVVPNISSFFSM